MNYRIILFSIVFTCSLLVLPAQSITTYFFAKDGSECSKGLATSYRNVKLVDAEFQRYFFEDYTIDSTLKARGYYLDNTFTYKTGTHTEYYSNGNKKSKGSYFSDGKKIVGQKVNTWFYWYENGSVQLEKLYALDTATNSFKIYIINFWDTAGIKKVIDGNGEYSFKEEYSSGRDSTEQITFSGSVKDGQFDGLWKGVYANGTLFCEETYNEEGLIEGKSYDVEGKSYTYTKLEVSPEFQGGDAELIRFIQKNTQYPQGARKLGVQGKVMVRFVIDESGKVKDPKITRSVSFNLDQEALRVVNTLPDFKPGILRGRPVSVYFNLPVSFRLQ